jgi:predicted RNA binding protein YcfA (HicA-like mRNA interferase family)
VTTRRLLVRLLQRQTNVRFHELVAVVAAFGFEEVRRHGSHRIYAHPSGAMLNLQEVKGEAKPYQVRQFLKLIERYSLVVEADE